jgi:dTDP-4-dehydrorhamnose 3,5-epimerase
MKPQFSRRRPRSLLPDNPDAVALILIRARRHEDERGWFAESYSVTRLAEAGIDCGFVQDNQSWSRAEGTVRGLHFQRPPAAQAKLITCLNGRILDVVLDIRAGSPSFGKCLTIELSDDGAQLFIPAGFAHGFVTLEPATLISYKVSAVYDPTTEDGVAWDDPALGLNWPLPPSGPVVSSKDAGLGPLAKLASPFVYRGEGPLALTEI